MANAKPKYVEIVQDRQNNNRQVIILVMTNTPLGEFYLSPRATSTKNVELLRKITQAYETYISEIIK